MSFAGFGASLTEKDAIGLALQKNPDIRVMRISAQSDSLSLERTNAGWLPGATLSASGNFVPLDSSKYGSNHDRWEASAGLSASQAVPGGGSLSASIGPSVSHNLYSDTTSRTTAFSISASQPLLKNAWQYGSQDYSMRIARMNHEEFTLNQKKDLLSKISTIRQLYWSCFEKSMLAGIYRSNQEYARLRLDVTRAKYATGSAAMLDTLSAAIEYLQATQQYLSSQSQQAQSKRDLSLALDVPVDSIAIDTMTTIALSSPLGPDEFISRVERFDPKLRVFEIMKDRLTLQNNHDRNQLLPDVRASASYNQSLGSVEEASPGYLSSKAIISLILTYAIPDKAGRINAKQSQLSVASNALQSDTYRKQLRTRIADLLDQQDLENRELAISNTEQELSQRQLDAALKGFEVGTVDNLTLLKARNDRTSAAVQYLQKQISLKQLEISFDELTGEAISRFGVQLQ